MKKILMFLLIVFLFLSCEKEKEVIIDGSSTVSPVIIAAAEDFYKKNPSVNVSIGVSGTGGGFQKIITGETDIANSSRKIKQIELDKAKENSIELLELIIAEDGITLVVNPENTWANNLTLAQLKQIWLEGSKIKKWSDIDKSWPDEKIILYGPYQDSGNYDYFQEVVIGHDKIMRRDYSPSTNDNQQVQGIQGDKYSLGFFGYAYYKENKEVLKAISLDGVESNERNIQDGKYKPLSRPLYIYINKKSLIEKEAVYNFVIFYLENANELVLKSGYIPLSSYENQIEQVKAARK